MREVRVQRERLRARARRRCVEDAVPHVVAGVRSAPVRRSSSRPPRRACSARRRGTAWRACSPSTRPSRRAPPASGRPSASPGLVSVNQITRCRRPHLVQHALAHRERLVRVVHVELALQVLAMVDGRQVELPAEHHARGVGRAHRLAGRPRCAAPASRRRRAEQSCCAGSRGRSAPGLRAPIGRRMPRTGSPPAPCRFGCFQPPTVAVQVQELGRRDVARPAATRRPYCTPTLSQVERAAPSASTP